MSASPPYDVGLTLSRDARETPSPEHLSVDAFQRTQAVCYGVQAQLHLRHECRHGGVTYGIVSISIRDREGETMGKVKHVQILFAVSFGKFPKNGQPVYFFSFCRLR